jgi:hypothetical protein
MLMAQQLVIILYIIALLLPSVVDPAKELRQQANGEQVITVRKKAHACIQSEHKKC